MDKKVVVIDWWRVCALYDVEWLMKQRSAHGYDPEKDRRYYKENKGAFDRREMTEEAFRKGLKQALGYTGPWEELLEGNKKILQVDRDVLKRLQELRQEYMIILRSNMDISGIREIKAQVDLDTYFDKVFFSRDLGCGKTDPQALEKVVEAAGTSELIFIDDTPENIVAIEEAGYKGIVYTDLESLKESIVPLLTQE